VNVIACVDMYVHRTGSVGMYVHIWASAIACTDAYGCG
jgi:hypothetical protein